MKIYENQILWCWKHSGQCPVVYLSPSDFHKPSSDTSKSFQLLLHLFLLTYSHCHYKCAASIHLQFAALNSACLINRSLALEKTFHGDSKLATFEILKGTQWSIWREKDKFHSCLLTDFQSCLTFTITCLFSSQSFNLFKIDTLLLHKNFE